MQDTMESRMHCLLQDVEFLLRMLAMFPGEARQMHDSLKRQQQDIVALLQEYDQLKKD